MGITYREMESPGDGMGLAKTGVLNRETLPPGGYLETARYVFGQ